MLDRDTTLKALECCAANKDMCAECPLDRLITCKEQLIISAHGLIKELTLKSGEDSKCETN